MTGMIGIGLFLIMIVLSALANAGQAIFFRNVVNICAILGMIWMLWPKPKLSILSLENKPSWIQKPQHFFRHTQFMLGGQILFLIFSLIFLCWIEVQTQTNHRLYPLVEGHILKLIQADPLTLFFWPWVMYSVAGVGLGYFCLYKDRIPNLFNVLIAPNQQQPLLFFHNYFSTVVLMTLILPFLISMVMILLLIAEGLNGLSGYTSFFESPIRSLFIALCLGMVLIRINVRQLPAMIEKRHSLGRILVSYATIAGLFMWWLSWMGYLAFEGVPEAAILKGQGLTKSALLQYFSESDQQTRLTLLVWSWWLIWLPMVASFIARHTIGRNLGLCFITSILFPFAIYAILSVFTNESDFVMRAWQSMAAVIKNPATAIALGLGIAVLLYFTLRRVQCIADLLRGFMQDFGRMRRYPLISWVTSTLYCLVAYLPSVFLIGWLGLQILVTVSAWFMVTVLVAFVGALYLENKIGKIQFLKKLLLKRDLMSY